MGNSRSHKKVVYFLEDMKNDDGKVIFATDTPYAVENNLLDNGEGLKVGVEDIWVSFRVEVQPLT